MSTTVAKWGNSLAVRIPQNAAKELNLIEGVEVEIGVSDGTLIIRPKSHRRYSLEELVNAITPENVHAEINSGSVVGNESW
jgi:antitoxin MazE